jgi:hypothetical protein
MCVNSVKQPIEITPMVFIWLHWTLPQNGSRAALCVTAASASEAHTNPGKNLGPRWNKAKRLTGLLFD